MRHQQTLWPTNGLVMTSTWRENIKLSGWRCSELWMLNGGQHPFWFFCRDTWMWSRYGCRDVHYLNFHEAYMHVICRCSWSSSGSFVPNLVFCPGWSYHKYKAFDQPRKIWHESTHFCNSPHYLTDMRVILYAVCPIPTHSLFHYTNLGHFYWYTTRFRLTPNIEYFLSESCCEERLGIWWCVGHYEGDMCYTICHGSSYSTP